MRITMVPKAPLNDSYFYGIQAETKEQGYTDLINKVILIMYSAWSGILWKKTVHNSLHWSLANINTIPWWRASSHNHYTLLCEYTSHFCIGTCLSKHIAFSVIREPYRGFYTQRLRAIAQFCYGNRSHIVKHCSPADNVRKCQKPEDTFLTSLLKDSQEGF